MKLRSFLEVQAPQPLHPTTSGDPAPSLPTQPDDPQPGTEAVPLEVEAERPSKRARTTPSRGPEAGPRRGGAGSSRRPSGKGPRPVSVRDLCRLPAGDGEPFLTRLASEIPLARAVEPLVARWEGLSRGDRVWAGGDPSAAFLRGALHPDMARDLYTHPSDVLLNKSAQSMVWVRFRFQGLSVRRRPS